MIEGEEVRRGQAFDGAQNDYCSPYDGLAGVPAQALSRQ